MYCDSLAGLLLAVKHWPAERLNFIVGGVGWSGVGGREEGRNIDGKRRTATPVPFLECMHRRGEVGGVFGVELLQRGCVYVAPRVFDGDRDKEWKREKSGVYGLRSLRAKVVAISGYNFSPINTRFDVFMEIFVSG